ncbi:FKBP-type peptidyl-prolyl cis-trans isomerase [Leucobacter zeae]|nr:FKBP-type peptidyl-prolyl cis-trans isomerase [Leucobacter zeae]
MKLTRAIAPVALVGALLVAGCSASGGPAKDSAGDDCLAAGAASKAIEVDGTVGSDLALKSKTPVSGGKKMERSVLKEGKGELVEEGGSISVAMSMFNGADGEVIQQLPASEVPVTKAQLAPWAYEGIRCAVPGQQAAIVASYKDVFADAKPADLPVEGITEKDSIVIVMDFAKSKAGDDAGATGEPGTLSPDKLLKKAEGTAQKAPKGFPSVELDKDGAPTITMPKGDAPKQLEVATLIEGDGETVKPGDRVYVNYRGVIWRTGEEFDSSWSRGEPANFTTTGVIGGFQKALEGQKVGSQVISVVPAEDGGYGAAKLEQMGHQKDDVMVFVLDILGTVHAE